MAYRGLVRRIGDTVHRPLGPYSVPVHQLLRHLEKSGFTGSPRVLGTCGQTEILSYIDGSAGRIPPPEWALTDDALVTVAELLRNYHRHVVAFNPGTIAGNARCRLGGADRLSPTTTPTRRTSSSATAPRSDRSTSTLPRQAPSPGSWLSQAAFWAPLLDPRDVVDSRHGRGIRRFRLLLDSYGASPEVRVESRPSRTAANDWIAEIIEDGSNQGHPAFTQTWTRTASHVPARPPVDRGARRTSWPRSPRPDAQ